MKKTFFLIATLLLLVVFNSGAQQASITIMNKSERLLTVKIMKGGSKKNSLYKTFEISARGSQTEYFDQTGNYFIKNQAVRVAKDSTESNDTIYSKGNPFQVISDPRKGYTKITIKYTVKESKKPISEGSIAITRKEYDEN